MTTRYHRGTTGATTVIDGAAGHPGPRAGPLTATPQEHAAYLRLADV